MAVKYSGRILAASTAAVFAFFVFTEDNTETPFFDKIGKVWTVCGGVTGPDIQPGREYDCPKLRQSRMDAMWARVESCITVKLTFSQLVAIKHWMWNVGESAVCKSTLVKRLNAGDRSGACALLTAQWRFAGGKDCFDPKNGCIGLKDRRELEEALCADRVTD